MQALRIGSNSFAAPQMLSLCSSIFSMAWCIASYHRCIRLTQIDKINISWIGSIVQSTWHLTVTSKILRTTIQFRIEIKVLFFSSVSRILSIAIVASLFPIR